MAADTKALTPDALLGLPKLDDGKHYELSNGDVILVGNAGALHELIKTRVFEILTEYRLKTGFGRAFAETQFTLRSDCARIPDVAWVTTEQLLKIPRGNQAIAIAPDIAVEIISESEQLHYTQRKLRDYVNAGVEVWQIFPVLRTVSIWKGSQGTRLAEHDVITSEQLPGFSVRISELFTD